MTEGNQAVQFYKAHRPKCAAVETWGGAPWGGVTGFHYAGCPVCGEYICFDNDAPYYWQNRGEWNGDTEPPCYVGIVSDGESP